MSQQDVNCVFCDGGRCMHPNAPEKFLSLPRCILVVPISDTRVPVGCDLQFEYSQSKVRVLRPPRKP